VRLSGGYFECANTRNSKVMSYMNAAEFTLADNRRRVSPAASVRARPAICGLHSRSVHSAISLARDGIGRVDIEAGGIPRPNRGTWTLAFLHSTIAIAIEAVPCGNHDGDGKQRRCPSRWVVGVVPVVDGEAQPGEREEDAREEAVEDSDDRSAMSQ
jgi:hypothetical protein